MIIIEIKTIKALLFLYLLMNYNTRNKDLVVKVVNDETNLNDDENFLFIREKRMSCISRKRLQNPKNAMVQSGIFIKAKKFFNAVQEGRQSI